jgi:ABC-type antimicrobial peptide transport system permease subunit
MKKDMLRNYLKIAFRNLLKQKFYTFINTAGLTLGITCCLLIFLFVRHELSYDHFHQQGERIFRVLRLGQLDGQGMAIPYTSGPYARALAAGNPKPVLAAIKRVYAQTAPQYPFQYTFLEEDFDRLYKTEQKQAQVFTIFAGLAIFIACLGLFGLAAYTTEQRRKEIGIRKILGASVSGLVSLVSREFIRLVLLANVLAWPLAYLAMQRWLENFSYRIAMGWQVYLAAGLLALVIALLTISFQALKVAVANPVEALREE